MTVKRLPFPDSLSTSMVPPIISTSFFTIDIPSPVPPTFPAVVFRSRLKDSKMMGRYSLLMPIPVSVISVFILTYPSSLHGSSVVIRDTVPPSGVYLIALLRRLIIISLILVPSQIICWCTTLSSCKKVIPFRCASSSKTS